DSLAAHQRDVLLAIQLIRDRRTHPSAESGLDIQKFFAFVGAISNQTSIGDDLEHQIARRGYRTAADRSAALGSPAFFLGHRIPSDQHIRLTRGRSFGAYGRGRRKRGRRGLRKSSASR